MDNGNLPGVFDSIHDRTNAADIPIEHKHDLHIRLYCPFQTRIIPDSRNDGVFLHGLV